MKLKLSNAVVEKLAHDGARPLLIHDEECRGFCVTVSRTGAKAFYFYGKVGGRPKRILIGKFPSINVTHARTICRGIIGDIAQGKVDPSPRKKGGKTIRQAYLDYRDLYAKENKRTWERDDHVFEKWMKPFHNRPLNSLLRAHVSDFITALIRDHSKSTAHKVRSLLSAIFEFSIEQGWCESNPVHRTHRPTYEKRERYLSPKEAAQFIRAIGKLKSVIAQDYIMMLLLTGARRSNVASMEKDEIDVKKKLWIIPRSKYKGKRPLVIPLVPAAMKILKRRLKETDRFIFPGRSENGHLTWIQTTIERLRELSKVKGVRIHDLRRTVGAWQNMAGVSLRVIQEGLGHADIRTTANIYTPTETAAVREALGEYAKLLLASPSAHPDQASKSKSRPASSRRGKAGGS